jgi:hypothetical protein
MKTSLLTRLPESQSILRVYAVIAVMFSGWTIIVFLRKLPSWLLTLNTGEIFTVFSYAMVVNLIESLIVLLLLLSICALLPPRLLRDQFAVRGTIASLGLIGSLITVLLLLKRFGIGGTDRLLMGFLAIILLTAFLLAFSSRIRFIQSAALWISDRLVVFLFILIPLFAILFLYVIFRNIT